MSDSPDPHAKIVSLTVLPSTEAHLLVGRLRVEGIQAEVSEGKGASAYAGYAVSPYGFAAPATGIGAASEVLVRVEDFERARALLATIES